MTTSQFTNELTKIKIKKKKKFSTPQSYSGEKFQKTLILAFEVIVQPPKAHFLTFSCETKIMKITHSVPGIHPSVASGSKSSTESEIPPAVTITILPLRFIFVQLPRALDSHISGPCVISKLFWRIIFVFSGLYTETKSKEHSILVQNMGSTMAKVRYYYL